MSSTNENKHLTLAEREIILIGITNGSTKTAMRRHQLWRASGAGMPPLHYTPAFPACGL